MPLRLTQEPRVLSALGDVVDPGTGNICQALPGAYTRLLFSST